jgi:hypothetical protein
MRVNAHIESILAKPSTADAAVTIRTSLYDSGIFEYLRVLGMQILVKQTSNVDEAALLGARAAGWQECLDVLINFSELVIQPTMNITEAPRADFGSLNRSLETGDLTQEEVDAIRFNKRPDYKSITSKPDSK